MIFSHYNLYCFSNTSNAWPFSFTPSLKIFENCSSISDSIITLKSMLLTISWGHFSRKYLMDYSRIS